MKALRVALNGAGFRLGALQAIADAGFNVVQLAGTSGGSIVAKQLCMTLDLVAHENFSLPTLVTKQRFCNGDALLKFLRDATHGKTFAQLDVDLRIIASDLLTEKEFGFSKDTTPDALIALAACASASIPFVYPEVSYAKALLVDGGCCNNVPADRLRVDSVPQAGVYLQFDGSPLEPGKKYRLTTIASRIIDLLLSSNDATHMTMDAENDRRPSAYRRGTPRASSGTC